MPVQNEQNKPKRNYFTNESPDVLNSTGSYGILPEGVNPTQIKDSQVDTNTDLVKLGSSMPSPMARLFLFSAALKEVVAMERSVNGVGLRGQINNEGELVATPYHVLVNELLDMLEFIFKFGQDPNFHVQVWNKEDECNALDASTAAHKRLASALRSAFEFGVLGNTTDIYLFKWGDRIIGGTSPVSLVYTSANLKSDFEGMRFTGNAGNVLFNGGNTPLNRRDSAFKEYLYRLYFTGIMHSNESLRESLGDYILLCGQNYDSELLNMVTDNPEAFSSALPLLTQGRSVVVAGVQMRVFDNQVLLQPVNTDYILAPSVNAFRKLNGNDERIPLLLTEYGEDGLRYAGREWNPASDKLLPSELAKGVYDRNLPGFGKVNYPYLAVSDFFEDRIIEVSYDINQKCFYTGTERATTYLLPLKKTFFEYFAISDLIKENGEYTDMLKFVHEQEHGIVTVELYLPLVNKHKICLHKTYNVSDGSDEKLDCYDGASTFDFAVSPFYRLDRGNVYNVMVGSTVSDISLKFFEQTYDSLNEVSSKSQQRSYNGNDGAQLNTTHINVSDAFNIIELDVKTANGRSNRSVLLPLFKRISNPPTKEFSYSIDFGTTNSYVAFACVQEGQTIGKNDVKPFTYTHEDTQMVMLNSEEGCREFGAFATAVKREFVPATLGDDIKFPMRTSVYETPSNRTNLKLFFDDNIGFNYSKDISSSRNYRTNIKWDRNDDKAHERIKAYFSQILWMMKNKSVLNGGSGSFKLLVTYPISMRKSDLKNFKDSWTEAIEQTKSDVQILYRTESVAPYYSYLSEMQYGEPYANMDIGGGTTDFLYVNPYSCESHAFSAFFAADDLWNDGLDRANRAAKENGFVKYFEGVKLEGLGDRRADVNAVIDKANSSADIISYLFSNDDWAKLSHTIIRSDMMMQLPIVHFSATVFYLAYVVHMAEVDVPKTLSFTGMGSKYVKLISSETDDISMLVNAIFKYVGKTLSNNKLSSADIKVSFAANPKEVTAKGALISSNYRGAITPNEGVFYGYEDEDPSRTISYGEVSADVENSVMKLYQKFLAMFKSRDFATVLGELERSVSEDMIDRLNRYSLPSLRQMKDLSSAGQNSAQLLKEPMFFWPLKNALYQIGKEMAPDAINEVKNR